MPDNVPAPHFVAGDDSNALRITLKDATGVVIDPSGGSAKLYALGFDNADRPGTIDPPDTIESVAGVIGPEIVDSDGNPAVEFQGLGALCEVGTGRRAQRYSYRIQFIDSGSKVWRQSPEGEFVVEAFP